MNTLVMWCKVVPCRSSAQSLPQALVMAFVVLASTSTIQEPLLGNHMNLRDGMEPERRVLTPAKQLSSWIVCKCFPAFRFCHFGRRLWSCHDNTTCDMSS
ncbi:hypothetical protein EDD16DRAFT_1561866 [Pisolithus croceorrhizus]|nr:hypothetical protein EDD16DRAFT_1561866 [Pisolithus croceorrhizus]KAI6129478.1 hypothetical protein EV401DRAFT_1927434 [Pisolithus croceorrhizus]KAI6161639.1 hypothetical protein EDD17DRAFT_1585721 [Pisolithus thermaeus]